MFTKYLRNLANCIMIQAIGRNSTDFTSKYTIKNILGSEIDLSSISGNYAYLYGNWSVSTSISSVSGDYVIAIGSGEDIPTEDDYNLSNRLTTGVSLNLTSQSSFAEETTRDPGKRYVISVTNTSQSNITITEIGLMKRYDYKNSSNSSYMLVDHTLLDTPLTLAPNESGTIIYELIYNLASDD